MVRLDLHPVLCLHHRHVCGFFQYLRHHAGMVRIEVGKQNKADAAGGRHVFEEPLEGVQPPCRSAYARNVEFVSAIFFRGSGGEDGRALFFTFHVGGRRLLPAFCFSNFSGGHEGSIPLVIIPIDSVFCPVCLSSQRCSAKPLLQHPHVSLCFLRIAVHIFGLFLLIHQFIRIRKHLVNGA